VNETDMQTALVAWLRGAGFDAQRVYLAEQDGFSPDELGDDAFATLKLRSFATAGPEVVRIVHEDADPGEEIEYRVQSHGILVVGVQAHTPKTVGDNSALAKLRRACTRLALPSVHKALSAAGLSLASAGDVLDVSTRLDTRWRGRASVELRFNALDDVSERLGYIATVEGTVGLDDETSTPFSVTIP
jgi:hypothetical protein